MFPNRKHRRDTNNKKYEFWFHLLLCYCCALLFENDVLLSYISSKQCACAYAYTQQYARIKQYDQTQSTTAITTARILTRQTKCLHSEITKNTFKTSMRRITSLCSSNGTNNNQHDYIHLHRPHSTPPPLQHVAFICDGNSRWAEARNLPTIAGHSAGANRLVELLQQLQSQNIKFCTMFVFSAENWSRPKSEVKDILFVVEQAIRQFYSRIIRERVQLRVIGNLDDDRLPKSLTRLLHQLERDTGVIYEQSNNSSTDIDTDDQSIVPDSLKSNSDQYGAGANADSPLTLCLAINYGGRQDMVNACKQIARKAAADPELEIDEELISQHLCTNGIPDPDLIIRTSGEQRLSNFMLWNAAYSELYFSNLMWPDFDNVELQNALDWYASRQRRYGTRLFVNR